MWANLGFGKNFRKFFKFLNKFNKNQKQTVKRYYTPEKLLIYEPGTPEFDCLQNALQSFSAELTQIPIVIGETAFSAKDTQYQYMPHNRCSKIAQYARGNGAILKHVKCVLNEIDEEWSEYPKEELISMCNKCADILATEDRHMLNAAIMLGQSKTSRQADEDTCRTINSLRNVSELLCAQDGGGGGGQQCSDGRSGLVTRASNGCIAAITPYNWTSHAVNLVLCPALMGKCVIWVPSEQSMLSSYVIFKAFDKAGLPAGVINFVPMKLALFLHEAQHMTHLTGLNFAGRIREYEKELAAAVAICLHRPKIFNRDDKVIEHKNFHFVHESANAANVVEETVRAAFDYNGQRGDSCENLYVPRSLWGEMQDCLVEEVNKLVVGDVCDPATTNSAVINRKAYDRNVEILHHAEMNDNCEILCGGCHSDELGYFIFPTVVLCKTPHELTMTRETEGPILSVHVYENKEMDCIIKHLQFDVPFTLAGSVFTGGDDEASKIAESLRSSAANLYLNRACIGNTNGHVDVVPDLNEENLAGKQSLLKHW